MADNKSICEEVEIAIYSDAELTEEQKNHIENCEECRALLSQITEMKKDLGALSVPGIAEGQITKAVMDSIRAEKVSKPFPKFKITHHLGTAAAVAVILVAALIIKNPSEAPEENGVRYDDVSGVTAESKEAPLHRLDVVYTDTEDAAEAEAEVDGAGEQIIMRSFNAASYSDDEEVSETESAVPESTEKPMLMMALPPPSAANGSEEALYDGAYDEVEAKNEDLSSELTSDKFIYNSYCEALDEDTPSAGGGGSSVLTQEQAAPEAEGAENIFDGIEFGDNLEENIRLANKRLFEITGKEQYFKIEDYSSNEEFLRMLEVFILKV